MRMIYLVRGLLVVRVIHLVRRLLVMRMIYLVRGLLAARLMHLVRRLLAMVILPYFTRGVAALRESCLKVLRFHLLSRPVRQA